MPVIAFPLAKLGYLALRQAAKPIANLIKNSIIERPLPRKAMVRFGQFFNKAYVQMSVRSMGHTPGAIKNLSETQALQFGSDIFGEMILFSIAATILYHEFSSNSEKEAAKAERLSSQLSSLQTQITSLSTILESLQVKVVEQEQAKERLEAMLATVVTATKANAARQQRQLQQLQHLQTKKQEQVHEQAPHEQAPDSLAHSHHSNKSEPEQGSEQLAREGWLTYVTSVPSKAWRWWRGDGGGSSMKAVSENAAAAKSAPIVPIPPSEPLLVSDLHHPSISRAF